MLKKKFFWVFLPPGEKNSPRSVHSLTLVIPNRFVKSYVKLKTKIKVYFILKAVKLVPIGICMQGL